MRGEKINANIKGFFPNLTLALDKEFEKQNISREDKKESWRRWIEWNKKNLSIYSSLKYTVKKKEHCVNPYRFLNLLFKNLFYFLNLKVIKKNN